MGKVGRKRSAWLRAIVWSLGPLVCIFIIHEAFLAAYTFISFPRRPEGVLRMFYTFDEPEELLADPLIFAGKAVAPLVIQEIRKKAMPKRLYAMGFLGEGRYRAAVPALRTILEDASETDEIRVEALYDLFLIDRTLGVECASRYADRPDNLGVCAREIVAGEGWCAEEKRTSRWEAFKGLMAHYQIEIFSP